MEPVNELVQAYAEKFTSPEDDFLAQINRETYAHHAQPQMLSGHLQGKFLELISMLIKPKMILEIGTFTGYSAICLAKGLLSGGELHTIEVRKEDADLSSANFHKAKATDKIILHLGNALEIIPALPGPFDLVFIDADKVNYTAYYELVLPKVNKGGLILADNVLFHGQVLEDPITGKNAIAIHEFNQHVQKDDRVEHVLMT
ncbi:MAG TPA: O-methyltransferase, partial [Chitinophagaceae bacterium]|nr:O-methyltransferase [Chitinophagaceae bacterium]